MRVIIFASMIFPACVSVAAGQSSNEQVDRVIYMTGFKTPQEVQEVTTLIRSVGEIKSASLDASQRSLSIHGTAEQVAIAESLVKELMASQSSDAYEYKMSSGDLIHVYYLSHSESIRDFLWIANTIRGVTDVRWAFTYSARRAFVVRTPPSKTEMTEWLVKQLDQPDGGVGSNEYRVQGAADDLLHVYFVKNVDTTEDLREIMSVIRSLENIRRLFDTGKPMTVTMRGTAEELRLADWLLQKLDQPTSSSASTEQGLDEAASEFQMPSSGDAVRVFYLRNATVQAFQNVASELRAAMGTPRLFTYNALGALVVHGTADQIAMAQNLINERFKNSQR